MLPENEERISPKEACRDPLVMLGGKPRALSWYYRIINEGARDINGKLVRLETEKNTSGRWTSRQALRRFLAALNGETPPAPAADGSGAALIELAAAGIH